MMIQKILGFIYRAAPSTHPPPPPPDEACGFRAPLNYSRSDP